MNEADAETRYNPYGPTPPGPMYVPPTEDLHCHDDTEKNQVDRSKEAKLSKKATEDLWSSRRKMAWVSLTAIIVPTIYILLTVTDPSLMDKTGTLMSWYYLALASIVGAYFGFKAWATIRGR